MQEKIKLITVEGASFSGKTSLIAQLAQYGYKFIGEYADYTNNGLDFPKIPFDTPEEARSSIDFFLEIEKRRTADAKKLAKNSNLPIIMDRSPFSCMVFQKMLEILTPQNPSVYTYTVDTFLQANLRGEIILPQAIIYLKPPSYEDFLQRVSDRGATLIPLLNDYTSGKVMELWYNRLVSTEFDPSNSRIIAGGKVCENALSLNSFISQANYSIDFSTQNIKNY